MAVQRLVINGKEAFRWGRDGVIHIGSDAYNKALKDGEPKRGKNAGKDSKPDKYDRD